MKDLLIACFGVAILVFAWRLTCRRLQHAGRRRSVSHLVGAAAGGLLSLLFLMVVLPFDTKDTGRVATPVSAHIPAPNAEVAAQRKDAGERNSQRADAHAPVATGAASEAVATEGDWPKAATITLNRSDDEKRYLADQTCLDEAECYGPKRFHRYILKRYPDLVSVQYHPLPDEASDSELVSNRKGSFFQSLYFAKQIQLADGQSLYDFIRSCSRGFTALDAAEVAYDDGTKASYFDVRYFPTLKRADTGEPVELQILFERRGDTLIAQSPFFTTNMLKHRDFLQRHHVTCWNRTVED